MAKQSVKHLAVLIPSYEPTQRFITLIEKLNTYDFDAIIVVNDGSDETYNPIFKKLNEMGCVVLEHDKNRGKGRALKTGIEYYMRHFLEGRGLVVADSDGQHSPEDILKVGQVLKKNTHNMVLGCRAFDEDVPFKSRMGNRITRFIYHAISGIKITDTQTGLRGFPADYLGKLMEIPGERFEYEMRILMELKPLGLGVVEVLIKTIYHNDNSGSHFNPWSDSFLIYKVIFYYIGASLVSFIVDYSLFTALTFVLPPLLDNPEQLLVGLPILIVFSNLGARVVSTMVNFALNRRILLPKFNKGTKMMVHLYKYYLLAVLILILDTIFVSGMSLFVGKYVAKVISGAVLYTMGFLVQKRMIFV